VLLCALYGAIVLAPTTAYLTLAHPDWAWLYLFPATRVPALAMIPTAASAIAALLAGWFVVGRLVVLGFDRRRVGLGLGVGALVLGVLVIVLRGRLFVSGTTADYHAGRALPIFEVKLGFVLIALSIGGLAAAVFVAWELYRDARKAASR
jgi:hypothetical protein